ncbi:MAG: type III pantothenate kinase [Oscillospiraceae bacterium]|jgi:type III pantothenate kinase|nr:type III pantothenate kinase [Oscillospiraceae bacterium]
MLLTLDIGNTHITLGVWDGKKLRLSARLATQRERTSDQYAVELEVMLLHRDVPPKSLSGAAISSVVPELTGTLAQAAEQLTGTKALVLIPGVKTGLALPVDNPAQVGADIVAASVSARERFPLPCLVTDLGTATKLIVLDEHGAFRGCAIAPGVRISLDALSAKASQLPTISFSAVGRSIGTNTTDCMTSGVVYGTAAMLDGMTERMETELGVPFASLVATGGLAGGILPHCRRTFSHAPDLVLDGLRRIYGKQAIVGA